MNNIYLEKYKKYKQKYLNLKNQKGGSMTLKKIDSSERTITVTEYLTEAVLKSLFFKKKIPIIDEDKLVAEFLNKIRSDDLCDNADKLKDLFDFNYSTDLIDAYPSSYSFDDVPGEKYKNMVLNFNKKITIKDNLILHGDYYLFIKKNIKLSKINLFIKDSLGNIILEFINTFNNFYEALNWITKNITIEVCNGCKTFDSGQIDLLAESSCGFDRIKTMITEEGDNYGKLDGKDDIYYNVNKNVLLIKADVNKLIPAKFGLNEKNEIVELSIYQKIIRNKINIKYNESLEKIFNSISDGITEFNNNSHIADELDFNEIIDNETLIDEEKARIKEVKVIPNEFYHIHLIKVHEEPNDFIFLIHGKYEEVNARDDEYFMLDGIFTVKKNLNNFANKKLAFRLHNYFVHIKTDISNKIILKDLYIVNMKNIDKIEKFIYGGTSYKYGLFGNIIGDLTYSGKNQPRILFSPQIPKESELIGVNNTEVDMGLENEPDISPKKKAFNFIKIKLNSIGIVPDDEKINEYLETFKVNGEITEEIFNRIKQIDPNSLLEYFL